MRREQRRNPAPGVDGAVVVKKMQAAAGWRERPHETSCTASQSWKSRALMPACHQGRAGAVRRAKTDRASERSAAGDGPQPGRRGRRRGHGQPRPARLVPEEVVIPVAAHTSHVARGVRRPAARVRIRPAVLGSEWKPRTTLVMAGLGSGFKQVPCTRTGTGACHALFSEQALTLPVFEVEAPSVEEGAEGEA
jgi:hypothetical protein